MNEFETLYDKIGNLTAEVVMYCGEKLMAGPEEEKDHYRKLMYAAQHLHDVAHKVEEHLAWD